MKKMEIEAIYRKRNTSKPHPEHRIYSSIRPVVELLIVSLDIGVEECKDDTHENDCTQSSLNYQSTISMAKTRHNVRTY